MHREFGRQRTVAVEGVSLRVQPGQIVCLLGPNGAGKTTTVRMCSTLLTPTSGTVTVAGIDALASPQAARRHIGLVLGGDRGFYLRASARDNLRFFAHVAGVAARDVARRVEHALESVNLADRAHSRVQEYSRGMRQRLHIARALLAEPRLLLLDEPSNGLDPEIALELRSLVTSLAAQGVGILLTTHYLAEAEALADHLIVITRGRIRISGTAPDISRHAHLDRVITLAVNRPAADIASAVEASGADLSQWPGRIDVDSLHSMTHLRAFASTPAAAAHFEAAMRNLWGHDLHDIVSRPPTLEESYLELLATDPGHVPAQPSNGAAS
ncbi:ABC transporter ATP-binding protein [Micrococcales bacterium 31B]|nr:ABC transporter ATP-binding protein [Micrococcales bacterium 31B]